jgi:hypothetical protein
MKFITSILLTALMGFAAGLQLPWYAIALAAFIVALAIPQKAAKAWFAGFLGIVLIWLMLSLINLQNGGGTIAKQMANVFPLKGNIFLLVTITCIIGGLVGGFGALSGHFGRKLLSK